MAPWAGVIPWRTASSLRAATYGGRDIIRYSTTAASYPRSLWTPEDDARLFAMKTDSKTVSEIVLAFPHRSPVAINNRWAIIAPRTEAGKPVSINELAQRKIDQLRAASQHPQEHQQDVSPLALQNNRFHFGQEHEVTKRHTRWSPAETALLLDLRLNQGWTIKSIAAEMGRSCEGVWAKTRKLIAPEVFSMKPKQLFTAEEDELLLRMRNEGASYDDIADAVDWKPKLSQVETRLNTIAPHLRKKRRIVKGKRKPGTLEGDEKAISMWHSHKTKRQIRLEVAFSSEKQIGHHMQKLCKEYGIPYRRCLIVRGPHFSPSIDDKIAEMYDSGASLDEINAAFRWRIPYKVMEERFDTLGGQKQQTDKERDESVIRMYQEGASNEEIAKAVNISAVWRVQNILRELHKRNQIRYGDRIAALRTKRDAENSEKYDAKIREMLQRGATNQEIQQGLNLSTFSQLRTVLKGYKKRTEHEPTIPRWRRIADSLRAKREAENSEKYDDKIREMLQHGATNQEMQKAFNLPTLYQMRSLLKGYRRRTEQEPTIPRLRRVAFSPEEFEKMDSMLKSGMSIKKTWEGCDFDVSMAFLKLRRLEVVGPVEKRPRKPPVESRDTENPATDTRTKEAKVSTSTKQTQAKKAKKTRGVKKTKTKNAKQATKVKKTDTRASKQPTTLPKAQMKKPKETSTTKSAQSKRPTIAKTVPQLPQPKPKKESKKKVTDDVGQRMLDLRNQGLSWQAMAARFPDLPAEVVQDFYFYGEQIVKMTHDGRMNPKRGPAAGRASEVESNAKENGDDDEEEHDEVAA